MRLVRLIYLENVMKFSCIQRVESSISIKSLFALKSNSNYLFSSLRLSFILPYNALWFEEFDTFKAFWFYSVLWNMKRPLRVGFIKNKKFFISKVKNMFLQIFLFRKNLSHITPTLWCAIKRLNVLKVLKYQNL